MGFMGKRYEKFFGKFWENVDIYITKKIKGMKRKKIIDEIYKIRGIMGLEEQLKSVHEVSDETLEKVNSSDRVVMSGESEMTFKQVSIGEQSKSAKPMGLWYGIGSSWVDWVRGNMPEWELDNLFKIDVNTKRMLIISTSEELLLFNKKYGTVIMGFLEVIDWSRVAADYGGIEISELGMGGEVSWYYGWDVASGCIWDDGIVVGVTKL